jgi:hypothetical protein
MFQQSRLAWDAARKKVTGEVGKLRYRGMNTFVTAFVLHIKKKREGE